MNKVILRGYVGSEPFVNEDKGFASLSLADNQTWKQNGEIKTKVRWHNVVFFGERLKVVNHLKKGSHILIEGELDYRETEHQNVKIKEATIIVNRLEFLDKKPTDNASSDMAEASLAQMHDIVG